MARPSRMAGRTTAVFMTMPASEPSTSCPATWRKYGRIAQMKPSIPAVLRCRLLSLLLAVGQVERRLQALGEPGGVVRSPEMHVEEPRRVPESMVVERGHVDAVLPEGPGDGIDLLVEEHEIAGDRRLAVGDGLEVHDRHHAHRGQERHANLRNGLRARGRHLEDSAADVAPRPAEGLLDLLG